MDIVCYSTCQTCEQPGNDLDHNCKTCKSEYLYKYNNNCYSECPSSLKTSENEKECLLECSFDKFEYNNICYTDCPIDTFKLFNISNTCTKTIPENFYKDSTDEIYKKCYDSCKKCIQERNKEINNCNLCKDGYIFLNDSSAKPNNCYPECINYYFFDENNNYDCIEYCPSGYKKIPKKKKCINSCTNDDEYIIEYNNECFINCPDNLKTDDDTKQCLLNCSDKQFEYENICYSKLTGNTKKIFQNGRVYTNNLYNFDEMFYDIIFSAYPVEKGSEIVVERPDNKLYQITNSLNDLELLKNKSKNINGISIIDLGDCEKTLKNRIKD